MSNKHHRWVIHIPHVLFFLRSREFVYLNSEVLVEFDVLKKAGFVLCSDDIFMFMHTNFEKKSNYVAF